MIKAYCQYSFGGFKTFFIEGLKNEVLGNDKEVTPNDDHGFPHDAHVFFQYGGSKIVYKRLTNGNLALIVREIPSNNTDGAGRPISCAVQFIGQDEDRQTLDNLTLVIANDIVGFSNFFADLFYVRQGLRIEGDKLHNYINHWKAPIVAIGKTHNVLQSIPSKQGNVFLFVPLSDNFGRDTVVTRNVCNELKLRAGELGDSVLSLSQLMKQQNCLKIIAQNNNEFSQAEEGKSAISTAQLSTSTLETPSKIKNLEDQIQQLKEEKLKQQESSFENLQLLQGEIKQKDEQNKQLNDKLGLYKKLTYIFVALSLISFLFLLITCSN